MAYSNSGQALLLPVNVANCIDAQIPGINDTPTLMPTYPAQLSSLSYYVSCLHNGIESTPPSTPWVDLGPVTVINFYTNQTALIKPGTWVVRLGDMGEPFPPDSLNRVEIVWNSDDWLINQEFLKQRNSD